MVIRDITEQRHTHSALLASEKLAVAGRLAATIAHEIHNPLDSVVNLLYLLENGSSPEESIEFLALARTELARVSEISRAMLGMYRESRVPISLDLRDLLESVLLLLGHQLLQLGVTVETHFSGDLHVTGFPVEIRQVFTNLLANAAEASSRGGLIRLGAAERLPASTHSKAGDSHTCHDVEVRIRDTGPGIDPSTLKHLFHPFFTTKGEHGTGLGLWISQGIVHKHGGVLELQSWTDLQDHGTLALVSLPCHPSPNLAPDPLTPAQKKLPTPEPQAVL